MKALVEDTIGREVGTETMRKQQSDILGFFGDLNVQYSAPPLEQP